MTAKTHQHHASNQTAQAPYVEESGIQAFIGQRRRYGHQTLTSVRFFFQDGTEYAAPVDPWPSVMPRKSQVREECVRIAKEAQL